MTGIIYVSIYHCEGERNCFPLFVESKREVDQTGLWSPAQDGVCCLWAVLDFGYLHKVVWVNVVLCCVVLCCVVLCCIVLAVLDFGHIHKMVWVNVVLCLCRQCLTLATFTRWCVLCCVCVGSAGFWPPSQDGVG